MRMSTSAERRALAADDLEQLRRGRRLADDLETRRGQQVREPGPQQHIVLGQRHSRPILAHDR
jgi:hypothetical protein